MRDGLDAHVECLALEAQHGSGDALVTAGQLEGGVHQALLGLAQGGEMSPDVLKFLLQHLVVRVSPEGRFDRLVRCDDPAEGFHGQDTGRMPCHGIEHHRLHLPDVARKSV